MNFNQIFMIVLIAGVILGTGYFLYSSSEEKLIEEEVGKNTDEYIEKNDLIFDESQEKGEKAMNYEIVECFVRSQVPDVLIYQNNVPVTDVKKVPFIICISAGEKRTGGYVLNLNSIRIDEDNKKILIELFLKTPGKGEMVTQAFTYPSIGIEINETLEEGDWEVVAKIDQKNTQSLILTKKFSYISID